MVRSLRYGWLMVPLLALAGGCQRKGGPVADAEPPVIPVSKPVKRPVTEVVEFTGRTNAINKLNVVPRVSGILGKMHFQEGSDNVKKGDLLFEIDPRPYQAALHAADAQVALNVANLRQAKSNNIRFKELYKREKSAVSLQDLDKYQALEDEALANLDLAKANLETAQLNLDWTKVRSEISGKVSRYYLTPGNLVTKDQTTLTTLVSLNPMYVDFDMDEPTYLRIKRAVNEGKIKLLPDTKTNKGVPALAANVLGLSGSILGQAPMVAVSVLVLGRPRISFQMGLQGEEGYPYTGDINFIDNQVLPATGSIAWRGVVANPKGTGGERVLSPGMFVRVQLPIGQPHEALLVIDRAIWADQVYKNVYVVDSESKIKARRVTTGALQKDGLRVVEGLKADDVVVVGAIQQVRPKMLIRPDPIDMPTYGQVVKTSAQKEKE